MDNLKKLIKQSSDGAEVSFSFFSDPTPSTPTIIVFPGGPGISNRYLHSFLSDLARVSGWNVGLVDLPNHDQSIVTRDIGPVTYDVCIRLLTRSFETLFSGFKTIVFLGQSLGSRIALDTLLSVDLKVSKSILINCPSRFEISNQFKKLLGGVALTPGETALSDELAFGSYWKKVCPLNFYNSVSKEELKLLTSNTKWEGNEVFLENSPSLEETATKLRSVNKGDHLTFIEGRYDPILIENNSEIIRESFPKANFCFIAKSGHFPMIEKKNETLQAILQELPVT